jgi:hypothetical protein
MTFQEAMTALRRSQPDADIGATARRGQYFDQAKNMNFRRYDNETYVADGARGKPMWLYVSRTFGRICCGNKDY